MTRLFSKTLSLCVAAVALSACGTTGNKVLSNLEGCERHYNGVVSGGLTGGSFSGSVKVDCAPPAPPEPKPSPPS